MSLAVEKLLVDQILATWRADAAFNTAFPLGRQLTQSRDGQLRGIICRAPGEYPQIWIEATDGTAGQNAPQTFAQQATSFSVAQCDMPVPSTAVVVIRTVLEKYDLTALSTAEQLWRRLMWAKFPKLGLAWVVTWTERTIRALRPFPDGETPPSPKRFVSTCTQTYTLRPFLSQLAS